MSRWPYEEGSSPTRSQREYSETNTAYPRVYSPSGPRPLSDTHEAPNPGDRSPSSHRQVFRESYVVSSDGGSLRSDPIHNRNPSATQYLPHIGNAFPSSQGQNFNENNYANQSEYNPYANQQQNGPPYVLPDGMTFPATDIRPSAHSEESASTERVRLTFDRFVGTNENQLHNALNANQVAMITLGCTFGTGLLVGSGTALREGGPLGLLISYLFVCGICYCMMTSLCEMATHVHHKKGFIGSVSKYIHPAVGFALGWTYLSQFFFIPAAHINTASTVMRYIGYSVENGIAVGRETPVSADAWRVIFITLIVAINYLPIRLFGHFEFWLSTFKVLILVTLIVFGLVVDMGAGPLKVNDANLEGGPGGYFWRPPNGPFGHPNTKWHYLKFEGGLELFWGFWATQVRALFALMGIELLGVTVGEIANPRISVPKAVRRTCAMVFTLYILGVIVIGLICSSQDPILLSDDSTVSRGRLTSPFIIAANRFVAKALVPSVSAAIIVFALSSATSNFYTGSRIIHGLALDGQAPAIFKKITTAGRPTLAIMTLTVFSFLSYIGHNEETEVFEYILDLTTTAGAISWICILWAHIRFRQTLAVQRKDLNELRYRAPLHPVGTWLALFGVIFIVIFKGVGPYASRGVPGMIFAYLFLVIFLILLAGWKYWHQQTFADLTMIDLMEDTEEAEMQEKDWKERQEQGGLGPWHTRLSEYI